MTTLHIVGYSGGGKTPLTGALVTFLREDGFSVGIVKHHHATLSRGKDSERLFATGAPTVVLAADGILKMADDPHLADAVQALGSGLDVVVVEGLKTHPGPKIWVGDGWTEGVEGVLAWVDAPRPGAYAADDVRRLYDEIVRPLVAKG